MIKQLAIILGLLVVASLGRAGDCPSGDYYYVEYKLVCANTPEDLNRIVNALKLTSNWWKILGGTHIEKLGPRDFSYCQTLIRSN